MFASLKRYFLMQMLVLTGLAAVMNAWAILRASRPDALPWAFQGALAEGFLLIVSFAAFTALDRPAFRGLALVGLSLASLMLLLVPLYLWWEIDTCIVLGRLAIPLHAQLARIIQTGVLTAGLLCLVPFAMVPSMKHIGRILQFTTILYLSAAYVTLLLKLWQIDSRGVEEPLVTLLIPAGVCMMGVFALDKFFGIRPPDVYSSVSPAVHLCCPRCHNSLILGLGESRCACCRLRISIEVTEPRCPNCLFNLYGLTRPICPECGLQLDQEDVPLNAAATRP